MARVTYIAPISEIVGSISGYTFQRNRSGTIVRSRPRGYKQSSSLQTLAQNDFYKYISTWRNLTLSQKQAWNDFADLHDKENQFGQTKTLSGLNWFQSVNYYLELLGSSPITTPPSYSLPPSVASFTFVATLSDLAVVFDSDFSPTNSSLIVRVTTPSNLSTNNVRSNFHLIGTFSSQPFKILDLKTLFENYFNVSYPLSSTYNNYTLHCMIQTVHNTSGITSPGVILSAKVSDDLTGIGYWFVDLDFKIS